MRKTKIVTTFLTNSDKILLLKRSQKVKSMKNLWAGISGIIEGNEQPLERAKIEVYEEVGIKESNIELIKEGKIVLIVTHDPILALSASKRLIIQEGGIVKILETTKKEKEIAHYLDCIENSNLKIREKIRSGLHVEYVRLNCREVE